jgi:hypothetical protein
MNLSFLFEILKRRWKLSVWTVIFVTSATAGILLLQKPLFRSSAIFTAANPNLGDRANIFRTQFWDQYFYYGSEMDNDRLMSIAKSEDMFRFLADSFQLKKHYKIKTPGEKGKYQTDKEFKENVTIHKNDYGHIKINVWDKDKYLSVRIANAFMRRVNEKAVSSSNQMKHEILIKLNNDYRVQQDSLSVILNTIKLDPGNELAIARKQTLIQELIEKEKLIQQFNTSINNVAALFVIEEAVPAYKKDKPMIASTIVTVSILSFFFSIFLIFLLEAKSYRNKKNESAV